MSPVAITFVFYTLKSVFYTQRRKCLRLRGHDIIMGKLLYCCNALSITSIEALVNHDLNYDHTLVKSDSKELAFQANGISRNDEQNQIDPVFSGRVRKY